ncbi:MAG: flagellar motor protein MotB, partial [Rhodospirillaceae bacterium]
SINHLAAARSINHLAAARSIWLISFTDLICLMLAFFVLVYSMSEPEQHRWQAMVQSLAARQVGGRGAVFNVALLDPRSPISLDYLGALLTLQFAGNPDLAGVVPVRQDDRVVIGLLDTQLFEEDQLTFSERGRQALFILGGVLGRISNRIEITGHAELELSAAPNERDSWELALSRSVAVGTALHQAGYQRRLVVRSVGVTVGRAHLIDVVIRDLDEGT